MGLTIWKQAELMKRSWPDFRVLHQTRWFICWEGQLRPFNQTYMVQIFLLRKRGCSRDKLLTVPVVMVIDPLLHRRVENPSEPIPHHYANKDCPEMPFLCLYDPNAPKREWHSRCRIATTIIPWTIDWLACYEGWLATGKWTGGGRH